MYINYLNYFSIKVSGEKGLVWEFLTKEYKNYISFEKAENILKAELFLAKDELKTSEYIVKDPISYDNKGVYIFDNKGKKARLNFETLQNNKLHLITVDPNFHTPFLAILVEYIIYVHLLKINKILCHASGFVLNNSTILCPAWRNVGKTNLLLQFMDIGAKYISDDWCIIDAQGGIEMAPKRIYLLDYNLISFPDIIKKVNPKLLPLVDIYKDYKNGEFRIDEETIEELKNNLKFRTSPENLFGFKRICKKTNKLDYVFYLSKNVKNSEKEVHLEKISQKELINKIIKITEFEQSPFRLYYSIFKSRKGKCIDFLEKEHDVIKSIYSNLFSKTNPIQIFSPGQEFSNDVKNSILETLNQN